MFPFIHKKDSYIGIEVTSSSLKYAHLKKNKKRYAVEIQAIPFESVKQFDNLKKGNIISSLTSREVLLRSLELELKNKKDLLAALEFQIEPLLPYPLEQGIFQFEIHKKNGSSKTISIFSVRKDHLHTHLESLNQFEIQPERVTCNPYALVCFLKELDSPPPFSIHVGNEEVTCLLMKGSNVAACRSFIKAGNWIQEILKTFLSFSTLHKDFSITSLLLLGEIDMSSLEKLQKITNMPICFPTSSSLSLTKEELMSFCIPIGNALASKGIDFRKKEFIYPNFWKKIRKSFFLFIILTTLLYLTTLFYFKINLTKEKDLCLQEYVSLLELIEDTNSNIPKTFDQFVLKIKNVKKEVAKISEGYPLYPQIPQVKDVLAWLATQPILASQDLIIESFHYSMVKRPDNSHRKEHYKVKVELLLEAKHSQSVRIFQDLLKTSTFFIDRGEDIQVKPDQNKYKVTFYLKDKTQYN